MARKGALLLVGLGWTGLAACEREEVPPIAEPPVEFATGSAIIETEGDTFRITIEIAETERERRVGLMRRDSLPENAGMLFLFQEEQPPDGVFWMFNTYIPLSIAFLDAQGTILNIRDMEPCPSPYPQWCPTYEARVPYHAALEVNRGYFGERGIAQGARVAWDRTPAPGGPAPSEER